MTQPFDDRDVVYRFTPEDRVFDEILVIGKEHTVYFRVGDRIEPALLHKRVITHLLKEREELRRILQEREHWADLQMRGMKILADTLKETIAERDRYKAALEQYADENNWLGDDLFGRTEYREWKYYGGNGGFDLAQHALNKKED